MHIPMHAGFLSFIQSLHLQIASKLLSNILHDI